MRPFLPLSLPSPLRPFGGCHHSPSHPHGRQNNGIVNRKSGDGCLLLTVSKRVLWPKGEMKEEEKCSTPHSLSQAMRHLRHRHTLHRKHCNLLSHPFQRYPSLLSRARPLSLTIGICAHPSFPFPYPCRLLASQLYAASSQKTFRTRTQVHSTLFILLSLSLSLSLSQHTHTPSLPQHTLPPTVHRGRIRRRPWP